MCEADNLTTFTCRMSWKSGSLNLLEPSGLHRACNGTAITLPFIWLVVKESAVPYHTLPIVYFRLPSDNGRTCGNRREIWHWTRRRVAQILNTTPDHITDEWPTCPQYMLRPQQQNRAVSWMLAILVTSCTQSQRELTLQEYIDILKRSRWKLSTKVTQGRGVGSVLKILDFSP